MDQVSHFCGVIVSGSGRPGFEAGGEAEFVGELPSILCNDEEIAGRKHIVRIEAIRDCALSFSALNQDAYTRQVRNGGPLILNLDELIALSSGDLPIVKDLSDPQV
jgi:hypothetical protein